MSVTGKNRSIVFAVLLLGALSLGAEVGFATPKLKGISVNTHTNFLAGLYNDLLGRSPGTVELNALLSSLHGGATRASVGESLLTSTEHRTLLIQGLYTSLLGRDADTAGLDSFLALLAAGVGVGAKPPLDASSDRAPELRARKPLAMRPTGRTLVGKSCDDKIG